MLQPGYTSLEEKPRARFLRRVGGLLLVAGLALDISMMLMSRVDLEMRLALLVLAPGVILLFTAFLAENTPSMRGCLTLMAVVLAFVAAFWAWVGVTVALSPEDEPPAVLRQAPTNAAEEDEGPALTNDATEDDMPAEEGATAGAGEQSE